MTNSINNIVGINLISKLTFISHTLYKKFIITATLSNLLSNIHITHINRILNISNTHTKIITYLTNRILKSINCSLNSINIAIQSRSKSTKISTIVINSLHQKVTTSSIVNLIRKETSSFIIIVAKSITAPTKKNKQE